MAHQLRESADRVIDGKGILRLEDTLDGGLTMASERQIAANRRNVAVARVAEVDARRG